MNSVLLANVVTDLLIISLYCLFIFFTVAAYMANKVAYNPNRSV